MILQKLFNWTLVATLEFAGLLGVAFTSSLLAQTSSSDRNEQKKMEENLELRIRAFLSEIVSNKQEVSDWLAERILPFCKYDSQLGFIHRDRTFNEGIGGSACTYTYEKSGERLRSHYGNLACRVNTYGDSFTSCEQVNDGETWQEKLAAHLREPVRNFGVGGYSVYLTYLRMKREEVNVPAKYIIFNIYDDDHFRNLISWQRITSGKSSKSFHPTTPYVKVNPSTGEFQEFGNPCPTRESVYQLCDLNWVYDRFKDDFVLAVMLARSGKSQENDGFLTSLAAKHKWESQVDYSGDNVSKAANSQYAKAGLFASMRIVEKVEAFAEANRKKVLYVLSCGPDNIAKRLKGEPRFDQDFVDFLRNKGLPYIDLMEAHASDYQQFKISIPEYINRYFVGHYSPQGNFFYAFSLKDRIVSMLEPRPLPYR
jgi:hypothetical protein